MTRVLVVDDEPFNLELVAEFLAAGGHEVARAANGREACSLLDTGTMDVLITDLHMPGMSGFDVVRYAQRLPRWVPQILMSGSWNHVERLRAEGLHVFRIREKPLDPEQLLRDVEELSSSCPTRSCPSRESTLPGQPS